MKKPIFLGLLLVSACATSGKRGSELASIHIVDRNGFTESISTEERLKHFQQIDFHSSLPYEKVLRTYKRTPKGDAVSFATSYYESGQVKQSLQIVNGRASGTYREWFNNGQPRLEVQVIGGEADLNPGAEKTWLFDGMSQAWDEKGNLIAEIPYKNGELEGIAHHFHSNGSLWKKIPYHKNQIHGETAFFLKDGGLFQTVKYHEGMRDGNSLRYWNKNIIAANENYSMGRLNDGQYYTQDKKLVSEVKDGRGYRAIFGKDYLAELHEIKNGSPDGSVQVFLRDGTKVHEYHVKDGKKDGLDTAYYNDGKHPKIALNWSKGHVQGPIKTWYPNGNLESQREVYGNKKHGLLSAWYKDGSLMLVEEYGKDKLIKGKYYERGNHTPVSEVRDGNGVATMHTSGGGFINRIIYKDGRPQT